MTTVTAKLAALPLVRKAYDRFRALEKRDRFAAKSLGLFLLVMILWFGLWEPSARFAADARSDRDRQEQLLSWMNKTRGEARVSGPDTRQRATGQTLLTIVSRTAQEFQIKPNRLQPEGDANVSVWFDEVGFNDLVRWLQSLDRKEGISVQQISVDRQEKPGVVNARIVLRS